ncbi:MAG: phosphoribosylanthranilate isomerase [Parcubacteria group bacterium]
MIIQIYEISSPAEARAIAGLGVDHVGILVGDGSFPRELSIDQAIKVVQAVPKPAKASVLALSCNLDFIVEIAKKTKSDILHLGALPELLSVKDVRELRRRLLGLPIMRSIPVNGKESVALAAQYDGVVDYLLLDTYDPIIKQFGATGKTHDWQVSREIVENAQRSKVILAGGLGPSNVAQAIRVVRPWGVDCKTKTDRIGSHAKDLAKVAEFVCEARASQVHG